MWGYLRRQVCQKGVGIPEGVGILGMGILEGYTRDEYSRGAGIPGVVGYECVPWDIHPPVVATSTHTVGKRAVRILLE